MWGKNVNIFCVFQTVDIGSSSSCSDYSDHSKAYFFISVYFIEKVYSLHYKDYI